VVFDGTTAIGYSQGTSIFFELMIARTHLLRRQSFDRSMPGVPELPVGVRYPTQFRAEFDEAANAYRFTLSGH